MYQFSDSDSADSDRGVRFKTDSIRNKDKLVAKGSTSRRSSSSRRRSRSRSKSPRHREDRRKKSKKQRSGRSEDDEQTKRYKERKKDTKRDRNNHRREDKRESKKEYSSPHKKRKTDRENQATTPEPVSRKSIGSEINSMSVETDKNKCSDEKLVLGPALPPHLLSNTPNSEIKSLDTSPQTDNDKNLVLGPALPPHLLLKTNLPTVEKSVEPSSPKSEQIISTCEMENEIIGPVLPPSFNKRTEDDDHRPKTLNNIGPALPPDLVPLEKTDEPIQDESNTSAQSLGSPEEDVKVVGPSLPPEIRKKLEEESSNVEEEEEDVYGPVPEGGNVTRAHVELEERALKMRIDQLEPEGDKQPVREEWMMTLPEAKAARFGLGPRSFRAKAGPDLSDRTSWTDTPEEKAKKKAGKVEPKVDLQKEAEQREIRKRDAEQEAVAKKNKKHKESLVEMHQKKLKMEKNESGPSERRPFSREIDLQVNRFDEAQKKAVLKKAQLLDTRFSTGESKYL